MSSLINSLFPNIATTLNSVGLFIDIIGASLVFKFGLPADLRRSGKIFVVLEGSDEAEKEKAHRYDRWAKLGLLLLIAGFILQLVSNYF